MQAERGKNDEGRKNAYDRGYSGEYYQTDTGGHI